MQASLPHEGVRDRDLERFGERGELRGRPARQHAAAGVEHRSSRGRERIDDPRRRRRIEARLHDLWRNLVEGVDRQIRREQIHRHVNEHRAGAAALRQVKRPLHDPRQILDAIDAVHTLAERPEDLELIRILMEVDLLVRMTAVEIRGNVAGNHDHRDRVERGIGDAGRGIGQPRAEMGEDDAGLARGAGVAVGGVRRNLFVARRDELDSALAQRVEEADDGVAAQPEDHLDAERLEVFGEQVRRDPRADPEPGSGGRNAHCGISLL